MSDEAIHLWSAGTTASKLRRGEVSSTEIVCHLLERARTLEPQLGAFITIDEQGAIQAARGADERRATGRSRSHWDGVPVTVKDLISTSGLRTTFGSKIFENHIPAADDIVVERLRSAGLVILGKTNTPEFGSAPETYGDIQPTCCNPWDLTRTSGGSSGGSAAALTAGLGPLSVGTDAGGSIRLPAACCGVLGMKPGRGLAPSGSAISHPRFDLVGTPGPMARNTEDLAALLMILQGPDPRDPLSSISAASRTRNVGPGEPMRAACSWTLGLAEVSNDVSAILHSAVDAMADVGVTVQDVDLDFSEPHPVAALFPLIGMAMLQKYEGEHALASEQLSEYGQAFITRARSISAIEFAQALQDGQTLQARVDRYLEDYDLLITPATSVAAWPHGLPPTEVNEAPVSEWEGIRFGAWPCLGPFNLTGHPALVIPCGRTRSGLPVSLQFVGPAHSEPTLIEAARRFEAMMPVVQVAELTQSFTRSHG